MKASINGPNRRKNRVGDNTIAFKFQENETVQSSASSTNTTTSSTPLTTKEKEQDDQEHPPLPPASSRLRFKVRSLEKYLVSTDSSIIAQSIGNSCLFTVNKNAMAGPYENAGGVFWTNICQ
jgi:hypothetical protein